jgi:hypothetical protein
VNDLTASGKSVLLSWLVNSDFTARTGAGRVAIWIPCKPERPGLHALQAPTEYSC